MKAFLETARRDEAVYISFVRARFDQIGTRPFHCHVTLYDDSVRVFPLTLPAWSDAGEAAFVESYVYAMLYNILSALGAKEVAVYVDLSDEPVVRLADKLNDVFQVALPKSGRSMYGKCLNVNDRVLAGLGVDSGFAFHTRDVALETDIPDVSRDAGPKNAFSGALEAAKRACALGVDIGGTDIKLAVSICGKLEFLKEFDWYPAGCARAEEITGPILLLTRLMRAAASLRASGNEHALDLAALQRDASLEQMEAAAVRMEAAACGELRGFDAIGLCFPDVVIRDRIIGGETYKTRGLRENPAIDYERDFAKITGLNKMLEGYARPGGVVRIINDGPMAACTMALELSAAGGRVEDGFFAHTLGTELGTGWVLPDGSIPDIPLEVYNFIIDLGSFGQRAFLADDVRSINNFNTLLPGTLQKCACQSGVFRLAVKTAPEARIRQAFERGYFVRRGDGIFIPTEPTDMRKPALEWIMGLASEPSEEAVREIFRTMGEFMAVTWLETAYILRPAAGERMLFGRVVKIPECFQLFLEGARRLIPGIQLSVADSSLANTPLMRQLSAHPHFTVAQFGQAVGAVYYGCLGL